MTDSNGREYTSNGCGPVSRRRPVARHGLVDAGRRGREVPRRAAARRRSTSPSSASTPPRAAATPPPPRPAPTWSRPRPTGRRGRPRVNSVFTSARSATSSTSSRPTAGATGVRFVRLTLLSSQGFGAPFRDLSEFGVYGRTAGADTTDPETTLDAGRPAVRVHVPPPVRTSTSRATFECKRRRGRVRGVHVAARGALPDGEHTFSVRAVDAAGNRIRRPRRGRSRARRRGDDTTGAAFTSTRTFECKLDAGEFAACTSPHAVTLPDGEHTFSVRAVDAAGNRDATPATRTFVVDTTAPETGFVGQHPALTNDTTPTFSFASSPARRDVRVPGRRRRRGPRARRRTRPRRSRTGATLFAVRAIRGPTDPTPAVHTFRVDTTAPDTAITRARRIGPQRADRVRRRRGRGRDVRVRARRRRLRLVLGHVPGGGPGARRARVPRARRPTSRQRRRDARGAPLHRGQRRARAPTLTLDRDTGPAPHTRDLRRRRHRRRRRPPHLRARLRRRTVRPRAPPPASLAHRYDATGAYTAAPDRPRRAHVDDRRGRGDGHDARQPAPGLSLQLSAPPSASAPSSPASPATTRAR